MSIEAFAITVVVTVAAFGSSLYAARIRGGPAKSRADELAQRVKDLEAATRVMQRALALQESRAEEWAQAQIERDAIIHAQEERIADLESELAIYKRESVNARRAAERQARPVRTM